MKTNEDFSREVIYRPDMKLDENEDFVTVFAITRRENDTNVLVSFFFLVVSVKKHCDYSVGNCQKCDDIKIKSIIRRY